MAFFSELMLGIMNWLRHEFSLRSMNCAVAHCGDKKVRFPRVLLFVPQTRGSLDYARDDGTFYSVIQSEAKNLLGRSSFLVKTTDYVPSSRAQSRDPLICGTNNKKTKKRYSFITTTKFALADFISPSYGRFHPPSGFHPSRTDFIA